MELELPSDFIHKPPKGFSYEVQQFKRNLLAIWICNHGIFSYTSDTPKSIWDFTTQKPERTFPPLIVKQ